MAPIDWRRWGHRFANVILFVIYFPSNLHTLLLALDLVDHFAFMEPRFVAGAFVSSAFVNGGLALTFFGSRRLRPKTILALRIILLVYVVPHAVLVTLLAPAALPDAWIP
ncbi:MAG TPA: hypothetical protein VER12_16890 [Polyangiaceae bacterium]|nr:hypothetical protein [Polyangiaceae bacterium]